MTTLIRRMGVLCLIAAAASVGRGDDLPFQIPPSGHPEQLVDHPAFPAPTAMAFDSQNRPYLLNTRHRDQATTIRTIREGRWVTLSFDKTVKAVRQRMPHPPHMNWTHARGQLVIDDDDALYATMQGVLIYSPDLGKTVHGYPTPDRAFASPELRTGANDLGRPPAICLTSGRKDVAGARWGQRFTLSVLVPTKDGSGLKLGEPIKITDDCLSAGSGGHSGGTSFAVTTGRYTHVVHSRLPKDVKSGGNPVYVATIDRKTRKVVARQFLVKALPKAPDVHARPTIAVGHHGYLYVLSGSHGQPFYYLRSLKPNDITQGWTHPVKMAKGQCYAGLVCGPHDRLYAAFRQWMPHATIGFQRHPPGAGRWSGSRTLVTGALKPGVYKYGIFYQRLFIDRKGTLYLAFTFYDHKDKQKGFPEALVRSKDGGRTWKQVGPDDLLAAAADQSPG